MAHAVQLTIRTGSQVTIAGQVQEVGVALTYELERSDADLMQVVEEKAAEVAKAHKRAWRVLRDQAVEAAAEVNGSDRQGASSEGAEDVQPASVLRTSTTSTEAKSPQSTVAQWTAIQRILEQTGLSVEEVSETAKVPFTQESLHTLRREQASQVLLVLQRVERGCYTKRQVTSEAA